MSAERTDAAGRARGRFIVIDGVDGCGKTTQARMLVERLARSGGSPLHLREPGSTPLGEEIREVFLSRRHEPSPGVEALLVTAARRHMLERVVGPALGEGRDVVCERFHSSTVAYQGVAGGLGVEAVEALLERWAGDPSPGLVVVLDVDVEEAARRRGGDRDRMEDRGLAFQERVARGFREYADGHGHVVLIDGARPPEAVAEDVWEEVERGDR
jgi:dTMP kinase